MTGSVRTDHAPAPGGPESDSSSPGGPEQRGPEQRGPEQRGPEQRGPELDRPEVVAEVLAAFHRYERALAEGDVAVLVELFWDDPRCLRYGVADRQEGADEITAWRRDHPSVPYGRRLADTRVVAVDDRTALVNTLFGYPDRTVEGRQSQVWVRFAEGWRIVAAHVSEVAQR